ncbi:hypothetical protein MGALJ_15320 [Mycobacterium gallinarum]|uniref:Uncharacterized protein n=1 Tax=Mycobacterium gallinarum TaxID=39689 RepID=A0A9W4B8C8_9MYCO|nr:hypothetical protein MGALJ_15320 [Mycobacterium gallinarum]
MTAKVAHAPNPEYGFEKAKHVAAIATVAIAEKMTDCRRVGQRSNQRKPPATATTAAAMASATLTGLSGPNGLQIITIGSAAVVTVKPNVARRQSI